MNLTPRPRDLTALLTGGRPAPADTGRPESAETEIPKNRKTVKPNDAEGWVKTSVSLRASTRRRLKTFAAEHDMPDPGSDRCRPRNVPGLWRGTMNRIMLLGLLVCISRVALCGVMGVMAETVARRAGSSSLRGLCRLCVVAYALVLVASFAPMDSAQTVVHRAVPLLFLVPNLFIWISMRPSGASMRGTRRRNDADGSADSISCEPMNKENK